MLKGIKDLEIMIKIFEFDQKQKEPKFLTTLFIRYDREIERINIFSANYDHRNTKLCPRFFEGHHKINFQKIQ